MENSMTPEETKDLEEKIEKVVEAAEPVADPTPAEPEDDQTDETALDSDDDDSSDKEEGPHVKDQFTGKVLKLSLAGALIDIGQELPAVIHITQIPRPEGNEQTNNINDLLQVDQEVVVWVKRVKDGRIELTMIKPFDLEWREIKKDMVVKGKVVRMEKFGVFVEIGAERPGLIHISEMAHSYVRQPSDMLKEGDDVEAQVLEVNRRKKQIKLSIKSLQPEPTPEEIEASKPSSSISRPVSARAQQLKEGRAATSGERSEKPRRERKPSRKRAELNSEGITMSFTSQDETGEEEQTAMAIALRDAMEKAKARNKSDAKKKSQVSKEQDDILSRTLSSKAS